MFGLTNDLTGSFTVQYSTNLTDWTDLGPATPALRFHRHQRAWRAPSLLPAELALS